MTVIFMMIILGIMLIFTYIINGKDYFSASFFMYGTFLLSSMVVFLNLNNWGVSISLTTMVVICSGTFVFFIGDCIGLRNSAVINFRGRRFGEGNKRIKKVFCIDVKMKYVCVAVILMLITTVWYFYYIYSISLIAGNTLGIAQMFKYARYAVVNVKYAVSPPPLLAHLMIISECLGYIFLFIIMFNWISAKKIRLIYMIPCGLYIVQEGISTERLGFIKFICAIILFFTIISVKKNTQNRRFKIKTIIYILIAIFVVLVGFRALGYITEKSSTRELWSDLSIYIGSAVPALDIYLDTPKVANDFFGKETLASVYTILRRLGLTDIEKYNVALSFVKFPNGSSTNIYTVFRRLIQDYGYLGMYIILFLEGLLYGSWTRKVKVTPVVGLNTIIYVYMFYPVVLMFIEEKFLVNFATISIIYYLIWFTVIYRLFIGESYVMSGEDIG